MSLLTAGCIENVVVKTLPKDFEYKIVESKATTSVYLTMNYGEVSTTIRFADHHTDKTEVKTVIICDNTKVKLIERTITKTANNLKVLSLRTKLGIAELKTKKTGGNQ